MRKSYLIAAAITLAVGGWILSGQYIDEPKASVDKIEKKATPLPRVMVRNSVATRRKNELVVLGHTRASRSVTLKAETSGRIVALLVAKGAWVKKGDVIARIAMNHRQSKLMEARALLHQRQIEFEAAKELAARKFRSKVRLAESQTKLISARAELAQIKIDIKHTSLIAPFAGVVETRAIEIGDFVAVGGAVATIVDLSPILVVADLTEIDIDKIRIGGTATAKLINGKIIPGKIRYIARQASNATRTFVVEMEALNAAGDIMAGMTAKLSLDLAPIKAHKISPAILTLSKLGNVGVKAVDGAGRVKFYPIQLIAEETSGMWVGGLPDRVRIITVGQEFVREGSKVNAVPEAAPKQKIKRDGRAKVTELQDDAR